VKPNVAILDSADELAEAAAQAIISSATEAVTTKDFFSIALSGGSTPKRLYELLANPEKEFRNRLPWDRTLFFWTDERNVPPDHPDSNYRMTYEAMLAHVPVPTSNIHRFTTELGDAEAVAADYEAQLKESFRDFLPRFDLVLLGLGTDGHTASLFPGTPALAETKRWVVANRVEKLNSFRFTMTLPVLNNASQVMFLVSGQDKAAILKDVLTDGPTRFPAQLITPTDGELKWLVALGAQASPPAP
jgi:6-phosphogluconolactonase